MWERKKEIRREVKDQCCVVLLPFIILLDGCALCIRQIFNLVSPGDKGTFQLNEDKKGVLFSHGMCHVISKKAVFSFVRMGSL